MSIVPNNFMADFDESQPEYMINSPPLDLSKLNEAQVEAVNYIDGSLLVLAGAGTGKTRVLTTRIANILQLGAARPWEILAVTFTNKASKEMQIRISEMVGDSSAGLWLGTFHSICLRILRANSAAIDYPDHFTVIDTDDQIRLIKNIISDYHIDPKQYPPKAIAGVIDRWKDKALTPELAEKAGGDSQDISVYKEYQRRLKSSGVMDFGDLLLYCVNLFQLNIDILRQYQNKFRYILVDEYQDTNVAQYLWLRLLAQNTDERIANICCVGDDDQSIYGWRGAEIDNILKFERDFADKKGNPAHTIRLEQNYRSTNHILSCASGLISYNAGRLGKKLYCDAMNGDKVKLVSLWDEKIEAQFVASCIKQALEIEQIPYKECAILVRAGHQTRAFEECFVNHSMPYRIVGGLRFYERMEIRDAIAYIRVMVNPDNSLALERIINKPKRGIGAATIAALQQKSADFNISLFKSIEKSLVEGELKPKIHKTLEHLVNQFKKWQKELEDGAPHHVVVDNMLKESGYLPMWKADSSLEAKGRVENLGELIGALQEYESLTQFLEHVSLVSDGDIVADDNMVSVMTMHAAKGLEFDVVFLCGWEEGLFPSQRAMDEKGANKGLEEERRLAYVGITRARKHLAITHAASRFTFGQTVHSIPSRFIDELPEEDLEHVETGQAGYGPKKQTYEFDERKSSFKKAKFVKNNVAKKAEIPSNSKFRIGEKVFHQTFGRGKVIDIKGKHIKVIFDRSGTKTLMENFLKKAA